MDTKRLSPVGFLLVPLVAIVGFAGCVTPREPRPALYPNDHYQRVGVEAAEMDISGCMYRAQHGAPREDVVGQTAKNTLGGAAAGAALGAIGGAITGSAGTGAAAGAAIGGTAGLMKSAYDASKPSATYRGYVEACLRDKGYEVVGWR